MRVAKIFALALLLSSCASPGNSERWTKLQPGKSLDGYSLEGNKIYLGGSPSPKIPHLSGVDVVSFQVLTGTNYARDKSRVYYPLTVVPDTYIDSCYTYATAYVVTGADPKTFRYLGKDYATDGKSVFFRGETVPKADGSTVSLLDGPKFFYAVKDSKRVFIYDRILNGADPKTFKFLRDEAEDDYNQLYILSDGKRTWTFDPPDWPELKRK